MDNSLELVTLQGFAISTDQPICDDCDTLIHFHLGTDTQTHTVDLNTILKCLEIAQTKGIIPVLNTEWWNHIRNEHG